MRRDMSSVAAERVGSYLLEESCNPVGSKVWRRFGRFMSSCGAPYGDYLYARFRNAVPAEIIEEFDCLESAVLAAAERLKESRVRREARS